MNFTGNVTSGTSLGARLVAAISGGTKIRNSSREKNGKIFRRQNALQSERVGLNRPCLWTNEVERDLLSFERNSLCEKKPGFCLLQTIPETETLNFKNEIASKSPSRRIRQRLNSKQLSSNLLNSMAVLPFNCLQQTT